MELRPAETIVRASAPADRTGADEANYEQHAPSAGWRSTVRIVRAGTDSFGRRPLVLTLAFLGMIVSGYLALFQLRLVGQVWDPLFGDGSERVVAASFSRSLPVPDALLGAVAYAAEMGLASVVLRPGRSATLAALFGLLGLAMGAMALFLVGLQALVLQAWCFLCLVSAGISLAVGSVAAFELRVAVDEVAADRQSEGEGSAPN